MNIGFGSPSNYQCDYKKKEKRIRIFSKVTRFFEMSPFLEISPFYKDPIPVHVHYHFWSVYWAFDRHPKKNGNVYIKGGSKKKTPTDPYYKYWSLPPVETNINSIDPWVYFFGASLYRNRVLWIFILSHHKIFFFSMGLFFL